MVPRSNCGSGGVLKKNPQFRTIDVPPYVNLNALKNGFVINSVVPLLGRLNCGLPTILEVDPQLDGSEVT